jgi:hypothetical protein
MASKKEKRRKAKTKIQKILGIKAKAKQQEEGLIIDGKGMRYVKRF